MHLFKNKLSAAKSLLAAVIGIIGLDRSSMAAQLVIDGFEYTNSATAQRTWLNSGAPPVQMAAFGDWGTGAVMVLNCDFATRNQRCTWDRSGSWNLSQYAEFSVDVYTTNPAPVSSFTLYFRSGNGWYGASAPLKHAGWQTLRFAVGDFIPEGAPAGWGRIDGIRLSPWKGSSQNTWLAAAELRASTPAVLLVRDTSSSNPQVVQETIDRHIAWLRGYNISCGVVTRAEVEAGLLRNSKLAILPYNENVSAPEMSALESFVGSGGKLMVYYLLPSRLPALLGLRVVRWTQGSFSAWAFNDPGIPGLPTRVRQDSWNITEAQPNGALNGRVTAEWEDGTGAFTGKAAWLRSDNGFFMSHVLLGDDAELKAYALLCLVGSVLPDVWKEAAQGALAQVGHVGPFLDYAEAVRQIRSQGSATLRARLVENELRMAEEYRSRGAALLNAERFSEVIFSANESKTHLRQAYTASLSPVVPEFRAMWEHHATGPFPGNWAAAAAAMSTNGFTAVFPNMLWGGLAHYDSAFLPKSDEFRAYGDQIAASVKAAHEHGLEVHVWKVNWNLLGAPQSFIDSLRASNRTQVSSSGAPIDWLCPSHPENLALETNSILEVVRKYDVDGFHFDYIRYPGRDYCYCGGCATRFQAQTGRTVASWPAGVLAPGTLRNAFLEWRRAQITRLVEAIHLHSKRLKPSVKISAAVFPDADNALDEVGQDWRGWATNGIVDFLCPMDYTSELHRFTNLVHQQLSFINGRVPVYPGIGAYVLEPDATLAQVQATRALNTGGFIIFELSPGSVSALLPAMASGATAADEPDTDRDGLPDSWEFAWFTLIHTADHLSDWDMDGLSDHAEYMAGTDPLSPSRLELTMTSTSGELNVVFVARGTEAIGYRNAQRHYALEQADAPGHGAVWSPVPGLADRVAIPGSNTVTFAVSPHEREARFYRLNVWLEQRR